MNPLTNEQPSGMPSWYDPFQEIRTMPKGWDLSSILENHPAAAQPAADSSDHDEEASAALDYPDLP